MTVTHAVASTRQMPNTEKFAVENQSTAQQQRAPLLMGTAGTNATTGSPQSQSPINCTSSVAAALAVLPFPTDDAPRVIRQFTSVFLVSSSGELWRVYDADAPAAVDRQMPSRGSKHPYRVFVALARKSQVRVHSFRTGETTDTDPVALQEHLNDSTLGIS